MVEELPPKTPKYPEVVVRLTGRDGNAFYILAKIIRALREAGAPQQECDAFWDEATAADYNNLLRVSQEWVTVR